MFRRFTDNADWAGYSNRRKEVVLVLNPSNVFPTNASSKSAENLTDLRGQCSWQRQICVSDRSMHH